MSRDTPAAEQFIFRGALGARDWLGPEGCGDFSFYFKDANKPLDLDNWRIDDRQNLAPMTVMHHDDTTAITQGTIGIENLRGNRFDIRSTQTMEFLPVPPAGIDMDADLMAQLMAHVGFRRLTTFTNIGNHAWGDDYGYAMIWFLLMLHATDANRIILPFVPGAEQPILDYRFGDCPIDPARLAIDTANHYVTFTADGLVRSKIGQKPAVSTGTMFSLYSDLDLLVVLRFDVDHDADYLNNTWTDTPIITDGTTLDAYNNDASNPVLPGRFCEMEAVGPALSLSPGESSTLTTTVNLFHGPGPMLNDLIEQIGQITFKP